MIIFNSIKDFEDATNNCPSCDYPLSTLIISKKSSSLMALNYENFPTISDSEIIEFGSSDSENHVTMNYRLKSETHDILHIDKVTGIVTGSSLEKLQNIFWDHEISLARSCRHGECHDKRAVGYVCETYKLFLERKASCLLPFQPKLEAFMAKFDDKKYDLISGYEMSKTFLLSKSQTIKELPLTTLYQIKGINNIINKIKTIIVFS